MDYIQNNRKECSGIMKYKFYFITWIDAQSTTEWELDGDVEEWVEQDYEVMEAGWVVHECSKYTVICSQIGNDGSLGNKTKIPNKWIVKKRVINGCRNRKSTSHSKRDGKVAKRGKRKT